jgi:DNA-binding MarR family transcriptional regulator
MGRTTRRENQQPAGDQYGQRPAAPEIIDALALAARLRPVLLRIHRYLRSEAHELGITSTQASLLSVLGCAPGISLGDLAAQEHMSAPTLVAHMDKLERAGLVERARDDPRDRRRVSLKLTPSGTEVVQVVRQRRTSWLASRLETLSTTDREAISAAIEPLEHLVRREA